MKMLKSGSRSVYMSASFALCVSACLSSFLFRQFFSSLLPTLDVPLPSLCPSLLTLPPLDFALLPLPSFLSICLSSPSSPSLQTAICSAVNGRELCGCDVVGLWSVCIATAVHFAYQPAAFTLSGPGRLPGWPVWRLDWLTGCVIEAVEQMHAHTHTTHYQYHKPVINYPGVSPETQASHQCPVAAMFPA